MKTELIVVGKTDNPHFIAGIEDYVRRICHYVPFNIAVIPELKNNKNRGVEQQKVQEGQLILKKIEAADTMVFVIGGPYGFSPEVYGRANEKISLSKLTFSHQMVRLIFVEQLYRACTILKGEPYHHE